MDTVSGEFRLRVRYDECDSMGITYHARYLDWFVIGRTELLRGLGLPYAELERSGLLLPVLEARCRYHTSTTYDDWITLKTRLMHVTRTRMEFGYQVFLEHPDASGDAENGWARVAGQSAARTVAPHEQTGTKPGAASGDEASRPLILAAEGDTSHAFIDETHRPVDVKKRLPDVWAKLEPLAASLRAANA